ncbi:T9SS type A sorting domain-containing protein [Ferruginibacter sp. HRS2-29]|uniref:T9SS type A sorting domain-containing protein n=1 Tax=Ferruginibacter sp. HRS2-29 TaxID=2487334 RepID=UPI0020CBA823|nr:T9SS type A sorting domain-containing protein [Ferruginibacter sp. HRS2-29]MCP9750595.1 T9SS C-terminal target domain-containing protein [Ferruginibacter sp. HRS2-29]
MKSKILLSSALLVTALAANAQQSNKAYAITGDGTKDFLWMNIRQVDLSTGKVEKTIFQRSKTNFTMTDAASKKTIDQSFNTDGNIFASKDYPTGTFVAGAAYDRRSNKLFFIPMRMGELRWLDLDSKQDAPKFYTISSPLLKVSAVATDEANHITRMVIGADGNGYAITNDGNSVIRFTTGKKPVITDLGNLIDDEKNGGISIHNKCTSWGGDMVADAFGKLYIISASHSVFSIDLNSRVATYKGAITGLPGGYTTNGAAVDAEGNIIVSSANVFEGYYKLKLDDLKAVKMEGSDVVYNASDLANGNLLLQKEADAAKKFVVVEDLPKIAINTDNRVFPNPVTGSTFKVLFDNNKNGVYTLILTDITGRPLQSKKVTIVKGQQTETISLNGSPAKGTYMLKALDEKNQVVFTEKLIIQ